MKSIQAKPRPSSHQSQPSYHLLTVPRTLLQRHSAYSEAQIISSGHVSDHARDLRVSPSLQMPAYRIPAITGKLRKRLILDLSVALGGGTALGYGYW